MTIHVAHVKIIQSFRPYSLWYRYLSDLTIKYTGEGLLKDQNKEKQIKIITGRLIHYITALDTKIIIQKLHFYSSILEIMFQYDCNSDTRHSFEGLRKNKYNWRQQQDLCEHIFKLSDAIVTFLFIVELTVIIKINRNGLHLYNSS